MLLGAFVALVVPASANQIFYFSGTCTDCNSGNPSDPATGTLVLTDNGATLSTSDFVSFTYNGTDLLAPFTISAGDPSIGVSGSIPSILPGPADVIISNSVWQFESDSLGNWSIGNVSLGDFGSASTWSDTAVPEPNTIFMLGAPLLALAFFRLRMRKAAQ
jgi:hypothetical protein